MLNKDSINIVRLSELDAKKESDYLNHFNELVLSSEHMYPGINDWLKKKVIPGLKDKERVAYVAYSNSNPIISAVVKRGAESKFCHLKIEKNFQDKNLGEIFFALMSLEVRSFAKEIYFTLPESLWINEQKFFRSFGFENASKSIDQYRKFEDELICKAKFEDIWKNVLLKLPKLIKTFNAGEFDLDTGLLMSINPKMVDKIFNGKKKVEIRTKFDEKLSGSVITIYSTNPEKKLAGQAKIKDVVKDTPLKIWEKYSKHIGCDKNEYDAYTSKHYLVYALILDDIKPFEGNVLLSQLNHLTNANIKAPQSYYKISRNSKLSEMMSIASLLQSRFKIKNISL